MLKNILEIEPNKNAKAGYIMTIQPDILLENKCIGVSIIKGVMPSEKD
jgi:hypothetical protein